MPIPTFDKMFRPMLALASTGPLSRKMAREAMALHFELSDDEKNALLPSGQATYVANRTGWAMTFLTKAGLVERVAPRMYSATERGRAFLLKHPGTIGVKDLEALEGWHEAWEGKKGDTATGPAQLDPVMDISSRTPGETVDQAVKSIHADVKSRLMDAILAQSPTFFERLVLDVLIAMGYGGSRDEAAHHLGKSGDEGIDGRINQDPLGLDQILVQAKRYAPNNPIDRKTIQAFIGSLAGQGVTKGIFITTSYFQDSAREFIQRGSNTKIVLIDGQDLLDLMMRHKIGVRAERTVQLLDLDQNYFEDED